MLPAFCKIKLWNTHKRR